MNRSFVVVPVLIGALAPSAASAQLKELGDVVEGRSLAGQVVKGAAVAYAVRQSSRQLDRFINTLTLRQNVPQRLATKVVPVLSVGERGYVGGAQVVGPRRAVERTQAVWQYEEGFHRGEYRIKALVPSASLNPLELRRVEQVGLGALIDVSLGGGFTSGTRSGRVDGARVLRAAAVAGAVLGLAGPMNQFINTITMNKDPHTRVVPQASFGETAYVGGAQVTGASRAVQTVKAVFEYWDSFDKGRYRVRVLVPVNGLDPARIRRVEGAGVVALIDTSIAQQKAEAPRGRGERTRGIEGVLADVAGQPAPRGEDRHDRGLHLGWDRGKHTGWLKKDRPDSRAPHRHRD